MIVFYDPADGQVHAKCAREYNGTWWQDRGYVEATVPVELESLLNDYERECFVTVRGGEVATVEPRANPIQPTPEPGILERQARTDRIREIQNLGMDNWTDQQMREMLLLLVSEFGDTASGMG